MKHAKLWLTVRPSVGIPVFLGVVATSAFTAHYLLILGTL